MFYILHKKGLKGPEMTARGVRKDDSIGLSTTIKNYIYIFYVVTIFFENLFNKKLRTLIARKAKCRLDKNPQLELLLAKVSAATM